MEDIKQLKEDRERAAKHLEEIKDRIAEAEANEKEARQEPLRELAIKAHNAFCRYNHTDACGWGYETRDNVHNWKGWAHSRWLDAVERVFTESKEWNKITPEMIGEIIAKSLEIRNIHPNAFYIIDTLRRLA